MKAYLDNQVLTLEDDTIAQALQVATDRAEIDGRIVVEVHADGRPLGDDLLTNPPQHDGGIVELKLVSVPGGLFVRETLLDAVGVLDEAKEDQDRAAGLIQSGQVAEAFAPMQRALEAWTVVREVVDKSTQLIGIDPSSVRVSGAGEDFTGSACVDELAKRLEQVRVALAGEDWGGLSDELAYEMDGQVERWRALLAALAERAMHGVDGR